MFIKLTNGIPENYTIGQLRRDNPQTSFPKDIPIHVLEDYGVYQVLQTSAPLIDTTIYSHYNRVENIDGVWTQVWDTLPLPIKQAEDNIRSKRDFLLAETDWIVSRAYERSESVPVEWATYRQQLRDLSMQQGFPYEVVWPERPV